MSFKPATTQLSRVFIVEGRARADHEPSFQECVYAGAPSYPLGEVTSIKCPSPDQHRSYNEVGVTFSAPDRATMALTGRYSLNTISTFLRLGRARCPFDVHFNFGECEDPFDYNTFQKKVILENVYGTDWSSTDFGAFDEDTAIDESLELSGRDVYELILLSFAERGQNVVTNPLVDVVICSKPSCGDCDDEDDGCEHIYALADSTPGSPGTAPDVIYSADSGVTLASDEITTMTNADSPTGIACIGTWVVVVSNDTGSLHYKLRATLDAGTAANWTEVTTGFVGGGEPNDIWSVGGTAFICGDGGYVYKTSNPAGGVTVIDAGVATSQNLGAVHALSRTFAVAVGANGAVVFTTDGATVQLATAPAAITLQAVWAVSEDIWWVGASNGAVYYTLDQGTTWTQKTGFPVTLTNVEDIAFANESVGYLSGNIAGPSGVILRTYDGGQSWISLPETSASLPAADEYTAIAACEFDENFIVSVGLADDAADGIYVVGQ